MYRLSLIINEIYLKYLPLAQEAGVTLNLDFPDPTLEIAHAEKIREALDQSLKETMKERNLKGEVAIKVHRDRIEVTDSETVLSKAACLLLSGSHVMVKSRLGFGTTVAIFFQEQDKEDVRVVAVTDDDSGAEEILSRRELRLQKRAARKSARAEKAGAKKSARVAKVKVAKTGGAKTSGSKTSGSKTGTKAGAKKKAEN